MFGSIINRFQTFSPVASPVTSPKVSRRKYKSPAHRRSLKDEYRDVQSEPEDACAGAGSPSSAGGYYRFAADGLPSLKKNRNRKSLLTLSKSKSTARLDISGPTATEHPQTNNYHHGSKSMGRLDGLRQVRTFTNRSDKRDRES